MPIRQMRLYHSTRRTLLPSEFLQQLCNQKTPRHFTWLVDTKLSSHNLSKHLACLGDAKSSNETLPLDLTHSFAKWVSTVCTQPKHSSPLDMTWQRQVVKSSSVSPLQVRLYHSNRGTLLPSEFLLQVGTKTFLNTWRQQVITFETTWQDLVTPSRQLRRYNAGLNFTRWVCAAERTQPILTTWHDLAMLSCQAIMHTFAKYVFATGRQ